MDQPAIDDLKQFMTALSAQQAIELRHDLYEGLHDLRSELRFEISEAVKASEQRLTIQLNQAIKTSEQRLTSQINQAIKVSEQRLATQLGKKIDDLSDFCAEAIDTSNDETSRQFQNHDIRIQRLETKPGQV